jgi:predicted PurR-regulated permease PerM
MTKETKGKPITHQTITMLVVIVVLAGGFAYSYASLSGRISTVCQQATSIALEEESLINNITLTLQSQMSSDNSLIQTLNSTRPAGYTDMIAILNNEITQDLALINLGTTAEVGVNSASGPCH